MYQQFLTSGIKIQQPFQTFRSSTWIPPYSGCWTLNFDGLFYYNSGLAGLGGIVRDDKGCLILAFAAIITAKQPSIFFFFF